MNSGAGVLISQADPRPMYLQIVEQVRRRIAVGDWPPGHELPSIRALAASVQVSVITVKRAYLELEREGVIVTRQGKGSFVADNAGLGARLHLEQLDAHLTAAAGVARMLGMTQDEVGERLRAAMQSAHDADPAHEGDAAHAGERSHADQRLHEPRSKPRQTEKPEK